MTIAAQVKQTIASLKGTKATLEAFYSIEQNTQNKSLLVNNYKKLGHIIDKLEQRVSVMEFEEPQYKGL